jgi:very-short-patch-repair endonuclease
MYIPSLKTIIEVDGPSHFLPIWGEEKLRKQIKADVNKTGLILSKGYVIIRIKNLADSVCLADREKLRLDILDRLGTIEKSFPSKSERYIEIEI